MVGEFRHVTKTPKVERALGCGLQVADLKASVTLRALGLAYARTDYKGLQYTRLYKHE